MGAFRRPRATSVHALIGRPGRPGHHAWRSLIGDRAGVASVEYALIGLLITVAIAGAVTGYATSLGTLMTNTFEQIAAAM